MEWPTVTLLLGALATIMVGLIQLTPKRTVHTSSTGQRCVNQQDLRELAQAFDKSLLQVSVAVHDMHEYVRQRTHDTRGDLTPINNNILTLLERTRLIALARGIDVGD